MIDRKEITNIVYDTLMQNRQHIQLDPDKVEDQVVDADSGFIVFTYLCPDGTWIKVKLLVDVELPG